MEPAAEEAGISQGLVVAGEAIRGIKGREEDGQNGRVRTDKGEQRERDERLLMKIKMQG